MKTRVALKAFIHRTAAVFLVAMMLFAALPATPAGAVSLDITTIASGSWESGAWPDTQRSGTISVPLGSQTVTGTGTAFLTEVSVGNILKTTTGTMIGTVTSIASDTELTLVNPAATARTDIAYHVQGVGPADNAIIASGHTVTMLDPVSQTGTVTVNAGGILMVSDPAVVFSTLTVNGTVTATLGGAFGALTIDNGGVVTAGTNGSYTASSLTINSGGTMNVERPFTVSGATTVTGTISFSSTSTTGRAMLFTGPVTLNSGAAWNEATGTNNGANNTYEFQNNFTNNASTFVGSDSVSSQHTFSGTAMTISGSTATATARVAITGTYTNNGTLTVSNNLSGAGTLTNSATGTLNIGNTSTLTTLTNAGIVNKTGSGPISTALANFTNTGTINLNGTGSVTGITNNAGGTVNIIDSGPITAFDNATATSVLNISDLIPPNITTLTVTAAGNTVNYSGLGDQTVKSTPYSNLIFSGSGNKSISMATGSTLATGNLSIAPTGTAKASLTGMNLGVNSLTLGGFGKDAGTWGPTTSVADFTDDNFFAQTTGYLNVATDSRAAQTITFTSTAPANAEVGGATYTPTATATSGLPVTFTIDASAASVCSINAGVVSFDASGTCVINANQAGDENYLAAPQVQQSFGVSIVPTFDDVPADHPFLRYIEAFYAAGITSGCSSTPALFCPDQAVTRGQMAVFIEKALGNNAPTPNPTDMFSDVANDAFKPFIEEFYNDGITSGCATNPLRYCPNQVVTRGQMAVFIEKALGNFAPTPNPTDMFSDVLANDPFKPFIEEFYNDGITSGCATNPLRFCPGNSVTRGEMAVFIAKAFNLPLP